VVVILAVEVISPDIPTERYAGGGTQSINYRVGWMQMAFAMIKEHPVIGIGTGNVPGEYNRYIKESTVVPRQRHWTHNSFLQMWAENGIFGFLVYVSIYVLSAGMMWRVIRKTSDPGTRSLSVLLLAVLTSYFFFAGTSNVIENENYWIVFAMCYSVHNFFANEIKNGENSKVTSKIPK
jgi:O-antigen ligase